MRFGEPGGLCGGRLTHVAAIVGIAVGAFVCAIAVLAVGRVIEAMFR